LSVPSTGAVIVLDGNLIEDNVSNRSGGGIDYGGTYSATIAGNVIRNNVAWAAGGMNATVTRTLTVANNAIYGNRATSYGGVSTYAYYGDGGQWVNNTIVGNEEAVGGSASQLYSSHYHGLAFFANNIVMSTDGSPALRCFGLIDSLSPTFTSNDVYAGGQQATGGTCAETAVLGTNQSVDPQFDSGANGHPYHLAPTSPLIDAGTNWAIKGLHKDLGGGKRIIDGGHGHVVDLGAYEYDPAN
jgi:hypothetical protein